MNRRISWLGLIVAIFVALAIGQRWLPADPSSTAAYGQVAAAAPAQFPAEERQAIQDTVALLKAGGPFPYSKDGSEFSNREGRLPRQGPGYYREYTVATAGSPDRGARRIVSGRAGEIYYTRDHYQTFIRLD
ncbi:MAG TPA: ribonuclease domain-containing protein [Dongiaceae bacterium]